MTTEHDVDLLLNRWLGEGATELPDRTFEAALEIVDHTHQRRVLRLPWRTRSMFISMRLAAAAALVVALAVGGAYIVGSNSPQVAHPPAPSAPATTSAPSATPTAEPTVTVTPRPTLIPGTLALNGEMKARATYSLAIGTVFTMKGQANWWFLDGTAGTAWFAQGPNEPNGPDVYNFGIVYAGQLIAPFGSSASATAAPSDIVPWLESHPDLFLGGPTPITVGGLSGTAFVGHVNTTATADAGVNLVCEANQHQCAQEQPNALGFAANSAFEIVVLPVNGKSLVFGLQGPSADWATNAKVLDPLLAGISFP